MPDNLYKRGDIWWGRICAAGKEFRRSLRTGDRKEAEKRLKKWKGEISAAVHFGEQRMTWEIAAGRYITEVAPQAIKPGTLKRYLVSFGQVGKFLEGRFVDQIDRKTLTDLISARKKAGTSNATINRDMTAISAVLSACLDWGALERNTCRDLDRRRLTRERREPISPPSQDDYQALLNSCSGAFKDIVQFLAETGCRQMEAVTLEWVDVDIPAGTVTFRRTKTNRPRTIRLQPETVAMLRARPRQLRASPLVFWHGTGEGYKNFASRFAQKVKAADLSFRCHDLRHQFAIDWLKQGGDIYALSRHLGHSSVKTTEIYLGYMPGHISAQPVRPETGPKIMEKAAG